MGSTKSTSWWERSGQTIPYRGLLQGTEEFCVYASVGGAVNQLINQDLWTARSLRDACEKEGLYAPNFGVADIAIKPVAGECDVIRHTLQNPQFAFSEAGLRTSIDAGGVVILSMELADSNHARLGRFHMFSLVSYGPNGFQVWDTNNFEGFFTEHEIFNGVNYPDGNFFLPHTDEDFIVLSRK